MRECRICSSTIVSHAVDSPSVIRVMPRLLVDMAITHTNIGSTLEYNRERQCDIVAARSLNSRYLVGGSWFVSRYPCRHALVNTLPRTRTLPRSALTQRLGIQPGRPVVLSPLLDELPELVHFSLSETQLELEVGSSAW
jgi:hypothetical protein